MVSLHNLTEELKEILKWGAIAVGILLALYLLYQVGKVVKEIIAPTQPPPPTVAFGKLTPPDFPQRATQQEFTYSIETVTGNLPTFEDRIAVHKIIAPSPTLLSLKRAQEKAAGGGFETSPQAAGETEYQWADQQPPFRVLKLDIVTYNFTLSSAYLGNPLILSAQNLPNETGAIATAKSFLTNIGAFPSDLDEENTKTSLLAIEASQPTAASSFSNAQMIRIDFFQKLLNEIPIIYADPPNSSMWLIVAGGDRDGGQVVEGSFFHQNISDEQATYPIKTAEQAFKELIENKAIVVSYFGESERIGIKNMYLAYYMANTEQVYTWPVVIFEGDGGFVAYVTATTDEWIYKK